MRPLEMVLLIFAIIVLVASILAAGVYGPELVKLIQQSSEVGADASFPIKMIMVKIGETVIQSFTG